VIGTCIGAATATVGMFAISSFIPQEIHPHGLPKALTWPFPINSSSLFRTRYLVIGTYVGIATVGIFALWYTEASFLGIDLSQDGHTLVSLHQLMNWGQCHEWEGFKANSFTAGSKTITFDNPCDYFTTGKVRSTRLRMKVVSKWCSGLNRTERVLLLPVKLNSE
jgi:hypothetical protein